ncbi:hypothetical protein FB45DRAFT_1000576 [Roridomyces roridus]|uniref:Uncharacterized protein n=1 Tax=Roridomyces roridus TaxID=1738132 RepID=A0AAD7CB91_9AGAR|nr:hypothetical protein FB45DRAFT_1000576 [Roridomyces roridus]
MGTSHLYSNFTVLHPKSRGKKAIPKSRSKRAKNQEIGRDTRERETSEVQERRARPAYLVDVGRIKSQEWKLAETRELEWAVENTTLSPAGAIQQSMRGGGKQRGVPVKGTELSSGVKQTSGPVQNTLKYLCMHALVQAISAFKSSLSTRHLIAGQGAERRISGYEVGAYLGHPMSSARVSLNRKKGGLNREFKQRILMAAVLRAFTGKPAHSRRPRWWEKESGDPNHVNETAADRPSALTCDQPSAASMAGLGILFSPLFCAPRHRRLRRSDSRSLVLEHAVVRWVSLSPAVSTHISFFPRICPLVQLWSHAHFRFTLASLVTLPGRGDSFDHVLSRLLLLTSPTLLSEKYCFGAGYRALLWMRRRLREAEELVLESNLKQRSEESTELKVLVLSIVILLARVYLGRVILIETLAPADGMIFLVLFV